MEKLNVGPGDRAIIIAGINTGKIVEVIEPYEGNFKPSNTHYSVGDINNWQGAPNYFCWIVESLGSKLGINDRNGQRIHAQQIRPMADRFLRKLPDVKEDENISEETKTIHIEERS